MYRGRKKQKKDYSSGLLRTANNIDAWRTELLMAKRGLWTQSTDLTLNWH